MVGGGEGSGQSGAGRRGGGAGVENNRRELPQKCRNADSFPERADGGRHARNGEDTGRIDRSDSFTSAFICRRARLNFAQQVADGCSRTLELGAHLAGERRRPHSNPAKERIGLGAAVSDASFGGYLGWREALEKAWTGPCAHLHRIGAHAARPDPSSASRRARFRSPRPPLRVFSVGCRFFRA